MYVVCAAHLEDAIDEFLEVYGAAPDIHLLAATPLTDWTAPGQCSFCEAKPAYLVV